MSGWDIHPEWVAQSPGLYSYGFGALPDAVQKHQALPGKPPLSAAHRPHQDPEKNPVLQVPKMQAAGFTSEAKENLHYLPQMQRKGSSENMTQGCLKAGLGAPLSLP